MKLWAFLVLLLIITCVIIADSPYGEATFAIVRAIPYGDKIGHFMLMGLLSFTMCRAFPKPISIGSLKIPLVIFILFVLIVGEEISQIWIDSRTFSFQDLAADILGIGVGGWLGSAHNSPFMRTS
ncbi:MAG: VanZ family protein [Bacteroidota bacterium]